MIYEYVALCDTMWDVRAGVIHRGRVHSILKIVLIPVGLIIIHIFLTM